jgi:hypothetical protein
MEHRCPSDNFEINAPASRVWQVLTGLDRYAEWNPQIPTASGRLEVGGQIRLRLELPERPTLDLSATIEEVLPERLLTWWGHVVRPWFFEGYRKCAIQPIGGGRTLVTHVEDIHGLLAPLFSVLMGAAVAKNQRMLNAALRARVESMQQDRPYQAGGHLLRVAASVRSA